MLLCEAFEPPQPLLEYQQAPLPYPVEALGELLGPAVERLAEVIGVLCAMAAQSVLATTARVMPMSNSTVEPIHCPFTY